MGSLARATRVFFGAVREASIEEGFFPKKERKGTAVLSLRTPFGMTGFVLGTGKGGSRIALVMDGERGI